ncbi:diadenosine tetraphosphatase [Raoultella terrigena]|uniref:metallophosphoesterase n=1 Tax=Raoultella terrigena TaxID=577 RepID=UPI000E0510E7|nr:metallophosphoesterase [Raoultella terrigena]SUQ57291.1 diadenosine tetraphosphatase [Raoultella terrigena]
MPASGQTKSRKIFIGDIHGQYGKLSALLAHLRSREERDRSLLIFVGDLIDNQPGSHIDHPSVLEQVRGEVAAGRAICLMGNHEFNAVGWLMRHPQTAQPLRPHTANNRRQHQAFLNDVTEDSAQHLLWVEWFKTLPLFVDFGDIRAVHACWDERAIARLRPWLDEENRLKPESWVHAFDKQHVLFHLLETILKGPELALPAGYSFEDKTRIERRHIRIRWWLNEATTYRQIAQVQPEMVSSIPDIALEKSAYVLPEVPVVVGHYTLSGEPAALSERVVCVDYNAAKASHPLRAWIYDAGETEVTNGRFVSV